MTSAALLERVSAIALALPETATKLSHGMPAFMVAKKMFVYFSDNHHGDGRIAIHTKTSGRDEQDMLIEADPDLFYLPAYLGPAGWIGMRLDIGEPDWDQVEGRIASSWSHAATPHLRALFGG